jgi:hypothetical protein
MKIGLSAIALISLFIMYNTFIKPKMAQIYVYGQIATVIGIISYIIYLYLYNPPEYFTVLELIKEYLLNNTINIPIKTQKKESRSVTNLMKKKIAANQQWKCGHCNSILDASYEVDHIIALFRGGTNDETNLIALCRNCHGKKTVNERL